MRDMSSRFGTGGGDSSNLHSILEIYAERRNPQRRFCIGNIPNLDDIALTLEPVSTNYCLFLAMDATTFSDEAIRGAAKSLMQRGLAYFCVWGPECERVHDLLDQERMREEPEGRCVITTWHAKESLPNALWFFANCVEPDDGFIANCTDWVALSVANKAWLHQMRTNLAKRRSTKKIAP
jgi:hypothetical protein